ncbi:MAG: hypothetical protein ACJ788_01940 [Ktedonobacteraceae bacterium]
MQQPPNNSYGPYGYRQPPMPQQPAPQYPYQHPGQAPSPPQQITPKKSRRRLWLILSIVGGLLVVSCIGCALLGNLLPSTAANNPAPAAQAPTSTPTPTFTTQATTAVPTATATQPAPTATHATGSSSVTHGTPRLGGPVSDFIGKYGQPDTGCGTCAAGVYNFQRIQGTQIDYISTMLTDANGHVNGFIVQGPDAGWDASTASAICESFGPSDVNYDRPVQVLQSSDGSSVEKVYKSAWLAGQLAVGDFQDGNTTSNNTDLPPGTFDIDYTYPSGPSKVSDCSLDAGIQRVF